MELDLRKLMEQAQRLTRDLEGRRAELSRREVEGQAGAGMVTAVMSGTGELLRLRIDPEIFRPKTAQTDQSLVEDLVVAAVNAALAEVRALQQRELSGLAAPGLVMPPGFPGGGQ